jgi:nucleoside-diphosphate-sugar epimerase
MKILLTGASGALGRAVRRVANGADEFVLLDTAPGVTRDGGICASITDADAVRRAAQGCDCIIHTAAMHGGWKDKASNAQFLQTNILGAEALFQAALQHGIRRLVFSSTMEVYVGFDWRGYGNAMLDESLPPRPNWIYPTSKLMVEQLGSMYARSHGLEVVQLRYMAFGDAPLKDLGLSLLCRYLTADDVARANLLAATTPGLSDEALNIGPETPLTQADVFDAQRDPWAVLERHWPGCSPVVRQLGLEPSPELFWPVTRIDRARTVLGWRPESSFGAFLKLHGWGRAGSGAAAGGASQ